MNNTIKVATERGRFKDITFKDIPRDVYSEHILPHLNTGKLYKARSASRFFRQAIGDYYTKFVRPDHFVKKDTVYCLKDIKMDIIYSIDAMDLDVAQKQQRKNDIMRIWNWLQQQGETVSVWQWLRQGVWKLLRQDAIDQEEDLSKIEPICSDEVIISTYYLGTDTSVKIYPLLIKLYPNLKRSIRVTKGSIELLTKEIQNNVELADSIYAIDCSWQRNKELNANRSNIIALISQLHHCSNLRTLSLMNNDLGTVDASNFTNLSAALSTLKSLRTLELANNNLSEMDAGKLASLSAALSALKNLCTLNLRSNQLGSRNADSLANLAVAIQNCSKLHTLDLSDNQLGSWNADSLANLAVTLSGLQNLSTFNLRYNKLGARQAGILVGPLQGCPKLHTLDLWGNKLGEEDAEGLSSLAEALSGLKNLRSLALGGNKLYEVDGDAFANLMGALSALKNLHTLDLHLNRIDARRALIIIEALQDCPKLHTLDLSWNNLVWGRIELGVRRRYVRNYSKEDFTNFAEALLKLKGLHTLELGGNGISKAQAIITITALSQHTNINSLYFTGIPEDFAKELGRVAGNIPNHPVEIISRDSREQNAFEQARKAQQLSYREKLQPILNKAKILAAFVIPVVAIAALMYIAGRYIPALNSTFSFVGKASGKVTDAARYVVPKCLAEKIENITPKEFLSRIIKTSKTTGIGL
ncbi:leucine-rich repeat domain-containing protein [Rickettsiales endosymbiont of Stachyamoeba lipophora]|uniref:hypothetical protein n=1 Tax=Rickettsiales endosymbiont of Stachyamoeba lipophora TaxID=2486578 RepID=UPI0013DE3257|nr:hypothetical protein [Rickettsiales endosymbiont of Stachyamoeba lipophora]